MSGAPIFWSGDSLPDGAALNMRDYEATCLLSGDEFNENVTQWSQRKEINVENQLSYLMIRITRSLLGR